MKLIYFIFSLLSSALFLRATPNTNLAQEYYELAKKAKENSEFDKSESHIVQALRLDPDNIYFHYFLLVLAVENNKYELALPHARFVLEKRPELSTAWNNVAHCLKHLGRAREAIPFYEKSIEFKPDHYDARQCRSDCLLKIGKLNEGWPDYELRFRPMREDTKRFKTFIESDGKLHDKKILLLHDFGMGDVLQFIRYAQLIKEQGAYIKAIVHKPLVSLIKLCPYIDEVYPEGTAHPPHDFSAVFMSLPYIFNTTMQTIPSRIPYLYADQKLVEEWQQKLLSDTNIKIGICWSANTYDSKLLKTLSSARSISLKMLYPLATMQGVSLYSLQKTTGTEQINDLPADFKIKTFNDDFDTIHGRFMDTAAVMRNLDLVLTIDTSIAHLAGGMGVNTWLMVPYVADWRWFEGRNDSPFYPTMKIFRQQKQGDWESVINDVKKELEKIIIKRVKP